MTSLPRLFPAQIHQYLPLSSQSSGLDLPKSLGAAQKRNNRHDTHHRQCLEQVPRAIVQKEDPLHGDDGSEEEGVRERRIANGLGGVAKVAAKANPLRQLARNDPGPRRKRETHPNEQSGHRGQDGKRKHERHNPGRVLGVRAEDVMDLGELAVPQGSVGAGRRMAGVQLDGDVEGGRHGALCRPGRAEDEAGSEGGGRGEELRGEVLVALWEKSASCETSCIGTTLQPPTYDLNHALARLLDGQGKRRLQPGSFPENQERLVRSLGLGSLLGSQCYFEGVLVSEADCPPDPVGVRESAREKQSSVVRNGTGRLSLPPAAEAV